VEIVIIVTIHGTVQNHGRRCPSARKVPELTLVTELTALVGVEEPARRRSLGAGKLFAAPVVSRNDGRRLVYVIPLKPAVAIITIITAPRSILVACREVKPGPARLLLSRERVRVVIAILVTSADLHVVLR
jgi:hypothetical protein